MANNPKTSEKQGAKHMKEPLKKHGDKMDLRKLGGRKKERTSRQTGGAGEPQTTPLEPEKQGGIGGP